VPVVFRNARVFDGDSEALREGFDVLVSGGVIGRIVPTPLAVPEHAEVVECAGRVLMPGLIDALVHVYAAGLNFTRIAQSPFSYLAHFAARFMRASLDCGFTTLRDVGGADVGLASALKEGLPVLRRPRHRPDRRSRRLSARRLRLRVPSRSHRNCGWRGRGTARRPGRVAARRIAHQADGLRRRGLSTDPLERCRYSASGFPSYDPRLLMQRPCL